MGISGTRDDAIIGMVLAAFGIFAALVLSPIIGYALLAYAMIYLVAMIAKPPLAYQWTRQKRPVLKMTAVVLAIFIAFVIVNDFVVGNLQLGSSLALYSTALKPILTIDMPIIQFLIWAIIIPILETMFFLGVIQFLLARRAKIEGRKFDFARIEMYIIALVVGALAALFHTVSQLKTPELLVMDMILFGIGSIMVFYYKELKQAGLLHIFLNSTAQIMIFTRMGII